MKSDISHIEEEEVEVADEWSTILVEAAAAVDETAAVGHRSINMEMAAIPQVVEVEEEGADRRYVHNVAAKQGFHSKSTGKNDARFIFVTRAKTTSSMTAVSLRVPPTPLALSAPTLHAMQAFLEAYPAAPPSSAGDTGCGKSTQIPQFLLDDGAARVVVTQPRRLSAMTLAQRIADERRVALGTDVGYSIRLDAQYSARHTRLLLCTTGILLKWLSSDPTATAFTHIVLDEVHERDKHSDFVLILLRLILPHRPRLRVILMSATIQLDKFSSYFGGCPVVTVHGRMHPVLPCFLDDILVLINYNLTCVMCSASGFADEAALGTHVATCFGSEWHAPSHPSLDLPDPDTGLVCDTVTPGSSVCDTVAAVLAAKQAATTRFQVDAMVAQYQLTQDALDGGVDSALVVTLLRHVVSSQYGPGAVLVFVAGWDDMEAISELMAADVGLMGQITLTKLHSKLSAAEQRR
ncbi:hypothetical protein DYB34_008084 [Aphanomyces astaci]|uniref:Helicase ATP-binding domain-containing protein n=1 Tax=Aphanomyces astaci TaxID=112090 RepID=A0A3R6WLX0_APHAT|nr:hypothetical protein DYB34_008084 [Aphanomyces astaci]